MKVLVISLLRMGDLLMHAHFIKEFCQKNRGPVDLLVHPFFKKVEFLLPEVRNPFLFERELCQRSAKEEYFNKNWALHHIDQLLNEMNDQEYDMIIDLTQTETSAWWNTAIKAKQKWGAIYTEGPKSKDHHKKDILHHTKFADVRRELATPCPFLHQLHSTTTSPLHFIELFKKSFDLPLSGFPHRASPIENKKQILLQTKTSDLKKNWPLQSWRDLIHQLFSNYPDYDLIILGEKSEIPPLQRDFENFGPRLKIVATSMLETYTLLEESELLITLDTSIKHLATFTKIPVLELALGSSRPTETGCYSEGAIIINPRTSCYPCRHSHSCPYKEPICHAEVHPSDVMAGVHHLLKGDSLNASLENPTNNSTHCDIHQVSRTPSGDWNLKKLKTNNPPVRGACHERRLEASPKTYQ